MCCENCNTSETTMILDGIMEVIDNSDATLSEILGALRTATLIYERQFNDVLDCD